MCVDISSGSGGKTNCVWTFLYKLRHFHKDKLGFQNQLLDLLSKAYSQLYAIKYNILSGERIQKYMVHTTKLHIILLKKKKKNSYQFLDLALTLRREQLKS